MMSRAQSISYGSGELDPFAALKRNLLRTSPNLPFSPVLAVFAIHFAVENRCLGSLLKIKKAIENRLGYMVWIFWYFPIVGKCYKFYATLSNAHTFHFLTT